MGAHRKPAPEPDYDADMRIPDGRTCGDCVFCRHCCALYGHTPADTSCDFWPNRFRPIAPSIVVDHSSAES